MTRLPRVNGREVLKALGKGGYNLTHVRGSHHYFSKLGISGLIVVPIHGNHNLPTGTLRAILRQAGLSVDEFVRLLD